MSSKLNFTKTSFLVYGLGSSGQSVVKYLKKKNSNYVVWDDSIKLRNKYKSIIVVIIQNKQGIDPYMCFLA